MTSPATQQYISSMLENEMNVTKRNGELETVSFDKILKRMKCQGSEVGIQVNYTALAMKVIDQLFDGISTTKIDELSAEQCASMASVHYDYNTLAARIIVSSHQKNTTESFSEVMQRLYNFIDKNGKSAPLVSKKLIDVVHENSEYLDDLCEYKRDFLIDYFGFKTLDRAYLMKIKGKTVERPQHMWLRVAIGIHGDNIENITETYELMSQKYFTHATPTLFNAGTPHPQLSSCFLNAMESDSIDGIYNTLKECALISKHAGGIGLHIHNIRASGSHIRGTNGTSNGIVPMLRVFNNTAKYVDQCVDPTTIIYTTEGPTEIQDCIPGKTEIYNTSGGVEIIKDVLEHYYEGEILCIHFETEMKELYITPEHPVLTGPNEWKDAKELFPRDSLYLTVPKYENDILSISEEDAFVYGLMFRFGDVTDFGYEVYNTPNIVTDYLQKYLSNKAVNVHLNENIMSWEPALHLPFRRSDFYNTIGMKEINARWLNLSKSKILALLKGLYVVFNKNINNVKYNFTYNFRSIQFICLRLGYLVDKNSIYDILPEILRRGIKNVELVENRIKSIDSMKHQGILYDLQMKTTHNYLLESGIVHNGGGKRNGSFAIYLEPWHADIELFLQMRKNHGDEELKARDLFYALWIPDLFMERIKTNGTWTLMCPDECPGLSDVYGDEFKQLYEEYEQSGRGRVSIQARELWFKILDAQMETGTPYLCYKDSANRKSNQKNLGTIKSSNLCVVPETFILTDKGHIEIEALKDQTVNVWNGSEFSETTVRKTGESQEVIDIYTDDGVKVTCTPYHKFYVQPKYSLLSQRQVEAKKLLPGDKLIKCDYPIIDGNDTMLYPYTHGFFCGDGTYRNITENADTPCKFNALLRHHFCKRHLFNETETYIEKNDNIENYSGKCKSFSYSKIPVIYLYDNKKSLVEHLNYRLKPITEEKNNRIIVTLPDDISEKYEVPLDTCSIKTKLDWFSGYCDADGTITLNGTNEQLQVGSINQEFLIRIKLMLQTCGINPKIKLYIARETSYLPDGRGGYRDFDTKPVYRLLVTSCDLYQLIQLGFKPHRLVVTGTRPKRNAKQFVKILKVVNENRISDTYCFNEPRKHMGIFNGIITGQCSEIIEYSDENETAVCNLASIGLPTFVKENKTFDYKKLHEVAKVVTKNLNKIIDVNFYPTEKTRRSNMRHRPIGIGVQGLADVFLLMGHAFLSEEARQINRNIFETIYHGALESSCEIAQQEGSYETFSGSPASKGILQFDLWDIDPGSQRYDWNQLKMIIRTRGLRNSLLLAPMPTASTSQILGFNECIEPITSNIYSRRTLAGDFIQVNRYLLEELISLGLWNEKIKNNIVVNHGSIQQIEFIPQEIKDKYKTVWEMPMRGLIDMSADRGAFICQSQSLNLWLEDPNYSTLTSMHFYSWQKGLKTGIYYLRRRGKHQAQQFTIEPEKTELISSDNDEICEMCSA
jgi:ribonucleoside-diphosphate reductase alpha chain